MRPCPTTRRRIRRRSGHCETRRSGPRVRRRDAEERPVCVPRQVTLPARLSPSTRVSSIVPRKPPKAALADAAQYANPTAPRVDRAGRCGRRSPPRATLRMPPPHRPPAPTAAMIAEYSAAARDCSRRSNVRAPPGSRRAANSGPPDSRGCRQRAEAGQVDTAQHARGTSAAQPGWCRRHDVVLAGDRIRRAPGEGHPGRSRIMG